MDKNVIRDLSYGLYAIGVKDGNRNCGCIVNTVFQITSEGPLVAVSMNKDNYTNELILKNKKFSISILSEDTNPLVIRKLGFVSGKDNDKWNEFAYKEFDSLPIVNENALGHMICEVESITETSTHNLIFAKVVNAQKDYNGKAMTYVYYHEVIKGAAPKKAPTYFEEERKVDNKDMWMCSVCGYIYDGSDFEKESDNYVCPLCGVPKDLFEKKEKPQEEVKKEDTKKWLCSVCQWEYDGEDFNTESEDYVCPICGVPKYMFEDRVGEISSR